MSTHSEITMSIDYKYKLYTLLQMRFCNTVLICSFFDLFLSQFSSLGLPLLIFSNPHTLSLVLIYFSSLPLTVYITHYFIFLGFAHFGLYCSHSHSLICTCFYLCTATTLSQLYTLRSSICCSLSLRLCCCTLFLCLCFSLFL